MDVKNNNKAVLDEWLESKLYEVSDTSYKKIRSSIGSRREDTLNDQERFIKNLVLSYKRSFGEWPTILQGEFK